MIAHIMIHLLDRRRSPNFTVCTVWGVHSVMMICFFLKFRLPMRNEASHSQVALVPDLSTQNTTFLILRSETSTTGLVAGSVPHWAAQ